MTRILGGHELFVGELLNTVPSRVPPAQVVESPRVGFTGYRLLDSQIFGMTVRTTQVIAPLEDREITQQIFDLALEDSIAPSQAESTYLSRIRETLGTPISSARYPNLAAIPSMVVFTADWEWEDLRISLSLYGGARQSPHGITTAGLFMRLKNELILAEKYLTPLMEREQKLWGDLRTPEIIAKAALKEPLRPFFRRVNGAFPADRHTRRLQKAFYQHDLFETPPAVSAQLSENDLVLWRHNGQVFVSTAFDTVHLIPNRTPVEVMRVLPAKGEGGLLVQIGDMEITDRHASKSLVSLTETLQKVCPVNYRYRETRDS